MDTSYLTYRHRAGYGRDDHMVDEVIARAARQLGADTTGLIAQHVGLASHPVPMPSCEVRMAYSPGARRHMARALREAFSEFAHRPDCRIDIVRLRTYCRLSDRIERYEVPSDDECGDEENKSFPARARGLKVKPIYAYETVTERWRGGRDWTEEY